MFSFGYYKFFITVEFKYVILVCKVIKPLHLTFWKLKGLLKGFCQVIQQLWMSGRELFPYKISVLLNDQIDSKP